MKRLIGPASNNRDIASLFPTVVAESYDAKRITNRRIEGLTLDFLNGKKRMRTFIRILVLKFTSLEFTASNIHLRKPNLDL
jgi:hypothetical protein